MSRLHPLALALIIAAVPARAQAPDAATPAATPAPTESSAQGSPRRALQLFIEACREGEYSRAAAALDLSHLPPGRAKAEGPRLARELKSVLDQTLWLEWETISDAAEGDPADGAGRDVVGEIPLGSHTVPLSLTRAPTGEWRVSAATVERIPALHRAYQRGWLDEHVPDSLRGVRVLEIEAWQWLGLLLALGAAYLLGMGLARLALGMAGKVASHTTARWDNRLVEAARGPTRYLVALAVFAWLVAPLGLALPPTAAIGQLRRTLLVVCATWLAVRMVRFLAETLQDLMEADKDDRQQRSIRTQITLIRRILAVVVSVVGGALVLTQFEVVRHLGMSLLASAGIAGIVVGLAAQKSISSLLAGIQLSIAQPIRIGDTVIVEGEWGWIEEINLTYVVVKVWDLRRLIVPISHFLDKPFQNWTRVSPEILGTVEIPADYTVPVDAMRAELKRLCEAHPLWDKKVCGLQITGVSERTLLLRALVSSEDSSKNWDLRCAVREGLVKLLQGLEGGRYLPRLRVDGDAEAPKVAPARP